MKLSKFFLPLLKENPHEAVLASHRLMLRCGMIRQSVSGIFSWLPFGQLVLDKINAVIRREHAAAGALEITVPCMQPTSLWEESHRNQAYGKEMLRLVDRRGKQMIYAPTNEELVTDLFRQTVTSYKQLPLLFYLIGNKFRDEIRPRFGTMRSREFVMKDAYSFDLCEEDSRATYQRMFASYLRIFKNLGVKAYPVKACTGAIGGDLSHEFIIPTSTGDTTISAEPEFYQLDATEGDAQELFKKWTANPAVNEEYIAQYNEALTKKMVAVTGVEVAHLFYFGQKYTQAMQAAVENKNGEKLFPYMGSYGIGTTRLVATIIEANHDKHGIVWPTEVAPFDVALVNLDADDQQCQTICAELEAQLEQNQVSVLHDNQPDNPGSKFARADLIGLPWQIIVGKKSLRDQTVTVKRRQDQTKQVMSLEAALAKVLSEVKNSGKY